MRRTAVAGLTSLAIQASAPPATKATIIPSIVTARSRVAEETTTWLATAAAAAIALVGQAVEPKQPKGDRMTEKDKIAINVLAKAEQKMIRHGLTEGEAAGAMLQAGMAYLWARYGPTVARNVVVRVMDTIDRSLLQIQ
jgi:hypothetical protein